MSAHTPTAFGEPLVVDPDLRARLEKLAAAAGRDVAELVVAVLRDFLDDNEQHLSAIDEGIREADAGQLLDYDEVKAELVGKLSVLASRR